MQDYIRLLEDLWYTLKDFGYNDVDSSLRVLPPAGLIALAAVLFGAGYLPKRIGLCRMAGSCKIRRPWLAFLPLGDMWITGALSDCCTPEKKGKKATLRWKLFTFPYWIVLLVLALLGDVPAYLYSGYAYVSGTDPEEAIEGVSTLEDYLVFGVAIAIAVLVVLQLVRATVALFRVYRLFSPDKATVYLVLTVLASTLAVGVTGAIPYYGWIGALVLLCVKSILLAIASRHYPSYR